MVWPRGARRTEDLKKITDFSFFSRFSYGCGASGELFRFKCRKIGWIYFHFPGAKLEGSRRDRGALQKKSVPLANIFGGGDQEFGLRPGTENVALAHKLRRHSKLQKE